MSLKNNNTFIALTALWAFVESGLGGMMHALHLPFTGIFLGGFSVLIVSMFAHFERKPYAMIIKATLIVMAIKFSVNPATSPFAYIAVGFQGLFGALLFSLPFRNTMMCIIYALVSMLESAFQKLLILTLFLGKSWINAIDIYFHSISKTFGMDPETKIGLLVVGMYVMIYFLWGIMLGIWARQIPAQVKKRMTFYNDLQASAPLSDHFKKKKNNRKKLLFLLALILIVLSFFIKSEEPVFNSMVLILRTIFLLMIWINLITPLWSKFMRNYLQSHKKEEMPEVLKKIPLISSYARPLYIVVSNKYKGINKYKEFILGLMVISLRNDTLN